MREIKFRAWDNYNQVMSYSSQYPNLASFFEYVGRVDLSEGFALTQYTGLKDKNGVEAYHKDIILRMGIKYVIEWHNNLASWYLKPMSGGWHGITGSDMALMCEKIGSVYENPELLEGK